MNDKKIAFVAPYYSHALLQDRYDKILSPPRPLRSLEIKYFDFILRPAYEANECLDWILSQDIYEDGLDKLTLSIRNFTKRTLDLRVLNKLSEIS